MAAFSYPSTITPQTRHARTTAPDQRADHNHGSAITTRSDDNFYLRTTAGAQCFPRHACPLYGAVLMQLHNHSGSAPAVATHGQNGQPRRMQNHAPVACMAKIEN